MNFLTTLATTLLVVVQSIGDVKQHFPQPPDSEGQLEQSGSYTLAVEKSGKFLRQENPNVDQQRSDSSLMEAPTVAVEKTGNLLRREKKTNVDQQSSDSSLREALKMTPNISYLHRQTTNGNDEDIDKTPPVRENNSDSKEVVDETCKARTQLALQLATDLSCHAWFTRRPPMIASTSPPSKQRRGSESVATRIVSNIRKRVSQTTKKISRSQSLPNLNIDQEKDSLEESWLERNRKLNVLIELFYENTCQSQEGIFRVPGSTLKINELVAKVDAGDKNPVSDDCIVIATAIRRTTAGVLPPLDDQCWVLMPKKEATESDKVFMERAEDWLQWFRVLPFYEALKNMMNLFNEIVPAQEKSVVKNKRMTLNNLLIAPGKSFFDESKSTPTTQDDASAQLAKKDYMLTTFLFLLT